MQPETFWSPAGYYVAVRQDIGTDAWLVRVLNFVTFKHRTFTFPDPAAARSHADLWRI
jgi:hypothetical protein